MLIIFALIWIIDNGQGGAPVKVGEYEKITQCREQGDALTKDWGSYRGSYKCIPVNAPGIWVESSH